jgi:ADP-ribosylglycohydrolase
MKRDKDKFRGCLIGGAAGDALGYTVEFMNLAAIKRRFGENGISSYELVDGVAQISDDTQMTLFTANGLLLGTTRGSLRGIMASYESYAGSCYMDWYHMQTGKPEASEYHYTWLWNVPELHHARAPGNTCLTAIQSGNYGSIEKPANNSKGCGGIMRVAPVGLYLNWLSREEIAMIGARTAALTHGHDLGYIPAAALTYIINSILYYSYEDKDDLKNIVLDCLDCMDKLFADKPHIGQFRKLIESAIDKAESTRPHEECISELGEGWVAEETLAIAVFCALRYKGDFDRAIRASVNHDGDSDSTGSVTGNILGAYHGYEALPPKYKEKLEIKEIILEIADDLCADCQVSMFSPSEDGIWESKYVTSDYKPSFCMSDHSLVDNG